MSLLDEVTNINNISNDIGDILDLQFGNGKMSLGKLKSRATDYARVNRYLIEFAAPLTLRKFYTVEQVESVCIMVRECALPAVRMGTFDHRNRGPIRQQINDVIYQPIPVSFFCDKSLLVRRFFQDWMKTMTTNNLMSFNYPEEYSVDITITVLDPSGKAPYAVQLKDAYPSAMADIQMSADGNDQLMQQNLTLSYHTWNEIDPKTQEDFSIGGLVNSMTGDTGLVENSMEFINNSTSAANNSNLSGFINKIK